MRGPRVENQQSQIQGSRDGADRTRDPDADTEHDPARLFEAGDGLRRPELPGARRQDCLEAPVESRGGHPEDLRRRGDLRPVRGVDPGSRRIPGPVDLCQRRDRDDPERRPDGAAGDGRRGPGGLGPPDHRGDAVVRVRPPGQEVGPARADHRPGGRPSTRGRRDRQGPDDGPPRRADPGVLHDPGRSHDRDADADPVVLRPVPDGRPGRGLARRRQGQGGPELRPEARYRVGDHGEGAAGPAGGRDRLRGRRRPRQGRDHLRRHDRHRRDALRCGQDRAR